MINTCPDFFIRKIFLKTSKNFQSFRTLSEEVFGLVFSKLTSMFWSFWKIFETLFIFPTLTKKFSPGLPKLLSMCQEEHSGAWNYFLNRDYVHAQWGTRRSKRLHIGGMIFPRNIHCNGKKSRIGGAIFSVYTGSKMAHQKFMKKFLTETRQIDWNAILRNKTSNTKFPMHVNKP